MTREEFEPEPVFLDEATRAYMIESIAYLHGQGLTGDDQPSVKQLRDSMKSGIRAVLKMAHDEYASKA